MCEIYRYFGRHWDHVCDFSDEAMLEMYHSESHGDSVSPKNGYLVGKQWMDVTITMWREDLQSGLLFKHELYEDPNLPHWWLDRILRGI